MYSNEEIIQLIAGGENSSVEFKTADVKLDSLAKEIAALSNTNGGVIFIGVNDDGTISGLTGKKNVEEWISNISRNNVIPPAQYQYYEVEIQNKKIGVLEIAKGEDKPYQTLKHQFLIRVGSTNRIATQAELMRLFQQSGAFHYDSIGVERTSISDLNFTKIDRYFNRYEIDFTHESETDKANLLKNIDSTLDYQVDTALAVIKNNLLQPSAIVGSKRADTRFIYSDKVFRELLVNACVHRNYAISSSKIRVFLFLDRIEFISPGKLPNTVTIEKLKTGVSYAVNPVIVKFMENLRYIDKLGRGIPMVCKEVEKNNKEIRFKEVGEEFKVTLYL